VTTGAEPEAPRRRVLVVDDDRQLRRILATNLRIAGFDAREASDGRAALAALDEYVPEIVLLDVTLPFFDGYEVCRRIRRHPLCSHVPILMLTARGETSDQVKGFEAGADDYMVKPFSPQEMLARLNAKIRRVESDSSLQPLTRLPGNVAIQAEIAKRLTRAIPLSVLYVDLDNFKAFNDVYGFVQGDEAIRLTASVLGDAVRRNDEAGFVGHIGGDDFIAITTTPERAQAIGNETIAVFDREVRALYTESDLQRGYIEAHDRKGAITRFPVISLSIALVSTVTRAITSYQEIGEVAAELKAYAKSRSGSVLVTDKRRT
jgi:diguanylate cyclase (GGDEF)-like protein